jgi:asparagine synthase (glutamine-hydrolysing)
VRAELVRWQRAGWRFDTGTVDIAGSALVADYLACFDAVATDAGAVGLHPLVDPSFLVALARTGGRWGFRGRTDAMRYLFADLLPDAVLSRSSKASFNGVGFGERERDFARRWDGAGVDHDLVDVEALRRHWLSESPLFTSAVPMHAAWLAGEGLGLEGQGGPVGE